MHDGSLSPPLWSTKILIERGASLAPRRRSLNEIDGQRESSDAYAKPTKEEAILELPRNCCFSPHSYGLLCCKGEKTTVVGSVRCFSPAAFYAQFRYRYGAIFPKAERM